MTDTTKPTSTEPVAAEDTSTWVTARWDLLTAGFLIISGLIFVVIGTASAQLVDKSQWDSTLSLFTANQCNGGSDASCVADNVYNWNCLDMRFNFEVATAFALISIVISFAASIAVFLEVLEKQLHAWTTLLLTFFGSLTLAVAWGIIAGSANTKFCGSTRYLSDTYTYAPGFALVVTAFAVTFGAFVLLLRRHNAYVHENFGQLIGFVLTLVGTILAVVGTVLPVFVNQANPDNTIGLWTTHICAYEGAANCVDTAIPDVQGTCAEFINELKTSASFGIISIFLAFFSAKFALADFARRSLHPYAGAAAALAATITLCIQFGITAAVYYVDVCGAPVQFKTLWTYTNGFGATVAAAAITFTGGVVLAIANHHATAPATSSS